MSGDHNGQQNDAGICPSLLDVGYYVEDSVFIILLSIRTEISLALSGNVELVQITGMGCKEPLRDLKKGGAFSIMISPATGIL